ncbi:lipoprotein [Streptomyces griseus]|uniref:lipoprotein n=1 Tax=Streptomyces griseus TaxID=1911 RepID=UPI00055B595C|nr:lipoprotein [Streptomyces griseus]
MWRWVAGMALLAGVLAGCGAAGDADETASPRSAPAKATDAAGASGASGSAGAAAASGGTLGGPGTACELPVSFETAARWTAEAVRSGGGSAGSGGTEEQPQELLYQGPVALACEVDAKPAGHIGFLRVYTGKPGNADARGVLEAFVAAENGASEEKYRSFKAGGLSGVEVEYLYTSEILDETKKEHALAVATADGPVVLHLGGIDTEEHAAMLPAFELAKRTLRTV